MKLLLCVIAANILAISCEDTTSFGDRVLAELEEYVTHALRAKRQAPQRPSTCRIEHILVKLNDLELFRNRLPVPTELKIPYCQGACVPTFAHNQRSQIIIRLAAGNGVGCVPNTDTKPTPANETIFSLNAASGTFDKVIIPNFHIKSCKCIG